MASREHLKLAYLHGGVVQYRPGESLGPRVLPDYELVLIIEGNVTYCADGREHAAPAGSMLFTRPGFHETYHWDPVGPTRHAYFHFDVWEAPERWPQFSSWPIIRARPDPVLVALFRHVVNRIYLHQDWPAMPPGLVDCLMVETLLSLFIEEGAVESANFERDRPAQVNRSINFMREVIDTDPHRRLNLHELAKVSGVSEKHLCRLFRSSLGHSPMRTYRLLCMQLALSLLVRSNLNVEEIADRCGFEDPAHFSRVFSKVFGCSPSQTRENFRQGHLLPSNPLPVDVTPRFFW